MQVVVSLVLDYCTVKLCCKKGIFSNWQNDVAFIDYRNTQLPVWCDQEKTLLIHIWLIDIKTWITEILVHNHKSPCAIARKTLLHESPHHFRHRLLISTSRLPIVQAELARNRKWGLSSATHFQWFRLGIVYKLESRTSGQFGVRATAIRSTK